MVKRMILAVLACIGAIAIWLIWPASVDHAAVETTRQTYAKWREVAQWDLGALAAQIAKDEAQYADLRPSAAARVVWASDEATRTPISIVYLHGFSASSMEIDPVVDRVAAQLGANVFYPRFAGHGRSGDALGAARFETWYADAEEAIALAAQLGERVIVIATSNGGALAHMVSQLSPLREDMAGLILVSPNFAVNNPMADVLAWPNARVWVPWIMGSERSFEPRGPLHAEYWTTRYGTAAVVEVVKTTKAAQAVPRKAGLPTLIIGSSQDKIVRADLAKKIGTEIGATWVEVPLEGAVDPDAHVVMGDSVSPQNTDWAVAEMTSFIVKDIKR